MLQTRTLKHVCVCVCVCVLSCFSQVQLLVTLWTIACLAPLSTGFSKQEYRGGLPCPPSGDLPDPVIEPASLMSLAVKHREPLQDLGPQILQLIREEPKHEPRGSDGRSPGRCSDGRDNAPNARST